MKPMLIALAALAVSCSQGLRGEEAPPKIEAFVGHQGVPASGANIAVPSGSPELKFRVNPRSLRARYRLEGIDADWIQNPGEMYFIIRFLNENRDQILQKAFLATGVSEGWNGSVETSSFTPRHEVLTVPEDAVYLSVAMSSAGPPQAVGVFSVSGVTVTSAGEGSTPAREMLVDSRLSGSAVLPWNKSGTAPTMAKVRGLDLEAGESPVFVIVDNDLNGHADWASGIDALPKVTHGEVISVRWSEAYNIGLGDVFEVNYDRLPPGSYQFVVEELGVDGEALDSSHAVSIEVKRPYWQSVWFWVSVVGGIGVVSSLWGRHLIRRRINRHLRHAQLIADERLRIARDLHDDLGTRLSHISLLGSYAEDNAVDDEARAAFVQIKEMSGELIRALSETVWMLNSKNDDMESLIDFLCRLVSDLCRLANIRCRIDAMAISDTFPISHEFRRSVSLSVKESINNVLRHSSATEIRMRIWMVKGDLGISIRDNGVGIAADSDSGSGLESIAQRMTLVHGTCSIRENEEGGTQVLLKAPIGENMAYLS